MYLIQDNLIERLRGIAATHTAPFYFYDTQEIRRVAEQFRLIPWHPKSIHFATMANESPEFLRVVRESGIHVFVNSLPHMSRAIEVGFRGEEIVFTASALEPHTMTQVQKHGALVNLDSLGQIELFRRLFPSGRAGLRCNVGELVTPKATRAGYFLGRESRLGLTLDEIEGLLGAPWVDGLHLYVGTDILDLGYFQECYLHIARLAPKFPNLRYLDFGGGFGVPRGADETFDFHAYGQLVADVMSQASVAHGRTLKLILEPGRILGAEAGTFVSRVVDVKSRRGRQLLGVNASAAQFPRRLFYPDCAHHPVGILTHDRRNSRGACIKTDIFGCSTYSRDYLAVDVDLPEAQPNDIVVIGHAGAYCASAHTAFLGFERPREFYV